MHSQTLTTHLSGQIELEDFIQCTRNIGQEELTKNYIKLVLAPQMGWE